MLGSRQGMENKVRLMAPVAQDSPCCQAQVAQPWVSRQAVMEWSCHGWRRDAAAWTPSTIAPILWRTRPTPCLKRTCVVVCIYIDTQEVESGLRPSGAAVAGVMAAPGSHPATTGNGSQSAGAQTTQSKITQLFKRYGKVAVGVHFSVYAFFFTGKGRRCLPHACMQVAACACAGGVGGLLGRAHARPGWGERS